MNAATLRQEATQGTVGRLGTRYLNLLKRSLMGTLHAASYAANLQADGQVELVRGGPEGRRRIEEGRAWPAFGETMIGARRLDHLRSCIEDVVAHEVPGDFIEAGVWRGGAAIWMKAVLAVLDDTERQVWLADSFAGLPPPNPQTYASDAGSDYHDIAYLRVTAEEVIENFRRYELLDERVRLVPGYFKDSLASLADETWAIVRLDADMYESTWDSLVHLYPRLSPGGYLIVDDHGCCPPCRQAVADYRRMHGIADPIERIDWTGACWQKTSEGRPRSPEARG